MKIEDIKLDDYNPREPISLEYKEYIRKNINNPDVGFIEPLVINTFAGRENILISGHVRIGILQEEGYELVDVSTVKLNKEAEIELNLSLNKVRATFAIEKLKLIDPGILSLAGFSPLEIQKIGEMDFSDIDNKLKDEADELSQGKESVSFKVNKEDMAFVKEVCQKYNWDIVAICNKL